MKKLPLVVVVAMCVSACGGKDDSPTAPPPAFVGLTGTVTATNVGGISGATVRILDGPNAGVSTTTNTTGGYAFTNLASGNANLSATASIYDQVILGVFINGTNTLNFTFATPACQRNNTAMIQFGNRSATASHDIIWDGALIFTLKPGETSSFITTAAGVPHTLRFRVSGTSRLACNDSSPVLTQCDREGTSCSGS